MKISQPLLRGAAIAAVGLAVFGATITTPTAEASVVEKKAPKAPKAGNDNDSGGISNVPIIGDLVSGFEGQEPEDIAVGAIQITAAVAETIVPMVIRAFK